MMKLIISVAVVIAFTTAELPPSNTYLPPPPSPRGNGYPQAQRGQDFNVAPEVTAAKDVEATAAYDSSELHGISSTFGGNIGHDFQNVHNALDKIHKNGFTRTSLHDHGNNEIPNNNYNQAGRNYSPSNIFGHSSEDANEPANYNFGYMVNDYQEGTEFGHREERQEETAQGEYHVVLPDGRKQTVSYQADESGFKPQISYENTVELAKSSYDSNANNQNGFGYHGDGNNDGVGHHGVGNNGDVGHLGNGDYTKALSDLY